MSILIQRKKFKDKSKLTDEERFLQVNNHLSHSCLTPPVSHFRMKKQIPYTSNTSK